jgi:hypothetical protein
VQNIDLSCASELRVPGSFLVSTIRGDTSAPQTSLPPDSMRSHVETDQPLGFKRRQSKGFQGLIEKEPVTKSPFLHPTVPVDDPFPPPPPPPKVLHTSHLPTPTSSASPTRPSLVSKRLHGPRLIGHDVPKRHRRKTVTFDEACEVVTFERDDSLEEEELFSDDNEGDYGETVDYDEPVESVEANHASLSGLVDSMIQDARGNPNLQTLPMDRSLPPEIDSKDGVSYGHTREQMILEKRREMRRGEQDEDMGYVTPPRNPPPVGRPSARRSMSTGDAEDLQAAARLATLNPPGSIVLPDLVATEEKDPLADSIARELRKLRGSTKSVSLASDGF